MNFIDCTHNLTSSKMCTSQDHGRDGGEEAIQPDSLETICDGLTQGSPNFFL